MQIFINNFSHALADPWPAGSTADIPLPTEALAVLDSIDQGAELRLTLSGEQGHEIISITRPAGQLTIQRGLEGTADQSWPAETRVYAALTAGLCDALAAGAPVTSVHAGETQQIDYRLARRWVVSVTQDSALSLLPAPAGTQLEIFCAQDEAGNHTVQLPEGVIWQRSAEPAIDKGAGCVTRLLLTSLGNSWLGRLEVYGEAPQGEVFVTYFSVNVASGGFDEGQYVLVRQATDGIEHVIKLDGISRHDVSGASSCVSISPDGRHVAVYQGASYSEIVMIDIETDTQRFVDLAGYGSVRIAAPARPSLQFSGGTLYALTADGPVSIDVTTGAVQLIELSYQPNPASLTVQTMSISGSLIAMTHNRTTAGAPPATPPVLLYDLQGELLPEQFALPTGGQLATTDVPIPSPYGAAGAFSPNGAYYALSVKMFFGDSPETAVQDVRLVIYDVETRAALHELTISGMNGYSNCVAWSKDSRYVVVTYDSGSANAGSAFDLKTNTLINFGVGNLANYPVVATNNGEILYSDRSFGADLQLLAFSSENGHSIGLPGWANMPAVGALPIGLASA